MTAEDGERGGGSSDVW